MICNDIFFMRFIMEALIHRFYVYIKHALFLKNYMFGCFYKRLSINAPNKFKKSKQKIEI